MIKLLSVCLFAIVMPLAAQSKSDLARWQREARAVTITRDDWGIAHVHGKTDADAVFGMIYAQAEDDFNRVEHNYLLSLGRLAETDGEDEIYRDLRMKLYIQPDSLKAMYTRSPAWLQKLMNAWADGLNFYLQSHPEVKPRVITRFEPWMALSFSEGSIGGDIETISLNGLERMYGERRQGPPPPSRSSLAPVTHEPTGSNGIAIAPSNTADHHALFLINPHTSFFFRSELQMTSDAGLDAYGAVTWGQFFVYQGWNTRLGWMHTSTGADAIDEYLETVTEKDGKHFYLHGGKELPVRTRQITVPFKTDTGMASKTFTVYYTQHGPVVRKDGDKWVSVAMMFAPLKALTQSYTRTKARTYKEFRQIMELHTNSSNNTIYADADGNIAYFHANFIPRRDTSFDWTEPVDGSNPKTDWQGVLSVDESPNLLNPASGWLYNSNNWPWSAAGPSSLKKEDFPKYVEKGGESFRGLHAIRVLQNRKDFTLQGLIDAAFDSYLPGFAEMLPPLIKSYDSLPPLDSRRLKLDEQIDSLRGWNYRWGAGSVPTTLAVFWATGFAQHVGPAAREAGKSVTDYMVDGATTRERLDALIEASGLLTEQFGTWKTPWGEINRFQRNDSSIVQQFDDAKPSSPVPFTSSRWGSLASFGARPYPGTRKWYGTSGNSFVAAVEFGDSVTARAITAGGESGHPGSPHFKDEVERYASGNLRPVYFYPSQLKGHTERVYRPGDRQTDGRADGQ
jgi:acyl-homoserine-lactone acylase